MASAAEQLASSITLANFHKATELKKRLWFTLGALILFRLLSFVPVPGIDPVAMNALYQTQSGGILDVFNTFSGGALARFSIVALGVMPYITASIVVQLGGDALRAVAGAAQRGRDRAQEAQPIYPLPDRRDHAGAGLSRGPRPRIAVAARRASRRSSRRACCSRSPAPSASSAAPCS